MQKKVPIPAIISLNTIESVLPEIAVFNAISLGFQAFSKGEAVIPPVGEMLFQQPPGEVHIKYGYLKSAPYYVVKIAAGFYQNPSLGLPSSQGLNLLFDKQNGTLLAILLDEGRLTDIRTAVAGALASQALASKAVRRLGIVGAGIQARLQTAYHQQFFSLEEVIIWNRDIAKAKQLALELQAKGQAARWTDSLALLCERCQLIVTTTPSVSPLIQADWVQPGTHITAIGADTSAKAELAPQLVGNADVLVVDSIAQSESRGEIYQAVQAGFVQRDRVLELGQILAAPELGRTDEKQITIADLTGVAVQDLMISQAIFEHINSSNL